MPNVQCFFLQHDIEIIARSLTYQLTYLPLKTTAAFIQETIFLDLFHAINF